MGSATTLVSLEDYLRTSYRPDCDYVEGEIEERNVGEFEHARVQNLISGWFLDHEREWGVISVVEQRIRVAAARVRIADVCLIRRDAPREKVTVTPPLLCVEILSPEDRMSRAAKVLDDYLRMGVEHLWLLDPVDRVGYIYRGDGVFKMTEERLEIAGTAIHVDLPALFARLD